MSSVREQQATGTEAFAEDVLKGLSAKQKNIPSIYLYDKKGSMLFEEIMDLPEYYPTRSELEILRSKKSTIVESLKEEDELYVVDLGAGNGLKTFILLKHFNRQINLTYYPIDISLSALKDLENKVCEEIPGLNTRCIHNDYIQGLKSLKEKSAIRKLILFLGSSIGNFTYYDAMHFLADLRSAVNEDDRILIGFDLKKDPEIIRHAYFDSKGITARFNLNLLQRINRELGGNFKEENFLYYPAYNPVTGELKSYLVSMQDQEVAIKEINKTFLFDKWESIHTECSNKYDLPVIRSLAVKSGFEIQENFFDSKEFFCDSLWKAV